MQDAELQVLTFIYFNQFLTSNMASNPIEKTLKGQIKNFLGCLLKCGIKWSHTEEFLPFHSFPSSHGGVEHELNTYFPSIPRV